MTTEKFFQMIGWYDGVNPVATHDPIPNNEYDSIPSPEDVAKCLCILCEQPLLQGPVRTVNIRWEKDFLRSYFYRVHRVCIPTPQDESKATGKAWEAIEQFHMEVRHPC